jgi:hypothetical protein
MIGSVDDRLLLQHDGVEWRTEKRAIRPRD